VQNVAVCCSVVSVFNAVWRKVLQCVEVGFNVVQCAAMWYVAVCSFVATYVATKEVIRMYITYMYVCALLQQRNLYVCIQLTVYVYMCSFVAFLCSAR